MTKKKNEDENIQNYSDLIPTPPDGGWGWVIVGASLLANIIVDGLGYSFGIFLFVLIDHFQTTKAKAALVGSLLCGVYLCAGPVVSGLVNRYGCRPVTVFGSIIAAAAILFSTFSPSIEILALTYGAIGGFGLGMVYLPSIVSVGYYFEKKRALATGIAVCGSGIGTFIFPPLLEYLLEEYGWKNTFYIVSGIVLNAAVSGMLMRPLQSPVDTMAKKADDNKTKNSKHRHKKNSYSRQPCEIIVSEGHRKNDAAVLLNRPVDEGKDKEIPMITITSESESKSLTNMIHSTESQSKVEPVHEKSSAVHDTSGYVHDPDNLPSIVVSHDVEDGIDATEQLSKAHELPMNEEQEVKQSEKNKDKQNDPKRLDKGDVSVMVIEKKDRPQSHKQKYTMLSLEDKMHHLSTGDHYKLVVKKEDFTRPMYRQDIFYSGSVLNIPQFYSQPDMRSYISSVTTIPDVTTEQRVDCGCWDYICLPKAAKDTLREMLDVSLLQNIGFLCICFGNILTFLGFFVPFVYTLDRAKHLKIDPSKAAFLLSVIGITNTIGRIITGFLADMRHLNSLVINNVTLLISGIATILTPFCITYASLIVSTSIFGFFIAAFISLTSIILCDLLGLEKLTNAFGLLTLFRGISGIAGPPVMGYIYDKTRNHDYAFYAGGALIIGGAVVHGLIHLKCIKTSNSPEIECNIESVYVDNQ